MDRAKFKKMFGVGPIGTVISMALFVLFLWAGNLWGHLHLSGEINTYQEIGIVLAFIGLAIYLWGIWVLRDWWLRDRLCTRGPFKWFRHPMYAGWITFVAAGLVLWSRSWVLVLWVVTLHVVWHRLVPLEERMMQEKFGDEYRAYASRTGRFFPRFWKM